MGGNGVRGGGERSDTWHDRAERRGGMKQNNYQPISFRHCALKRALRELNNIVHLMWQWRGGGVRSGERRRESGKEAAKKAEGSWWRQRGCGSATLEGGEEAAARLWRARSWRLQFDSCRRGGGGSAAAEGGSRRQRGNGGQRGGCSSVLKGGEKEVSRRDARSPLEKTQLSLVGPCKCRQILIMPEGIICFTFTLIIENLFLSRNT